MPAPHRLTFFMPDDCYKAFDRDGKWLFNVTKAEFPNLISTYPLITITSTESDHDRFSRLSETEVAEMQSKARAAEVAWNALRKIDDVAIGLIAGSSTTDRHVASAMQDVLDAANTLRDHLPVPAYIAPVKRWAGGPGDNWYWDRP
jgi:hypothetical protein